MAWCARLWIKRQTSCGKVLYPKPQKWVNKECTHLCSSASDSTSPIFWAICCRAVLKFEYCCCNSVLKVSRCTEVAHQMPTLLLLLRNLLWHVCCCVEKCCRKHKWTFFYHRAGGLSKQKKCGVQLRCPTFDCCDSLTLIKHNQNTL